MSSKYLDLSGLSYLWGKIKAFVTLRFVKVNGTALPINDKAVNIETETAYDPATNKIATMSDVESATPNVGHLKTNNTTAQTPSASESFTGNISLHKVSKTGSYNDLNDKLVAGHDIEIVHVGNNLPEGYTELEYIESTGTQWIDTGVKFLFGDEFYFDFMPLSNSVSSENKGYGAGTNTGTDNITGGGRISGGSMVMWVIGGNVPLTPSIPSASRLNNRYIENWKITSGVLSGTLTEYETGIEHTFSASRTQFSSSYTSGNNLYLFRDNSTTYAYPSATRLCATWLKRLNGEFAFNLVPAKNSEGVVGLYDTVSNTFITNSGTDVFVAGAVKTIGEVINFVNDDGFITSAELPTKTSDFTNDGSDGTSTYVEADELSTVATTGSYNDLNDQPTIPDDSNLVHKTGNESISNRKLFYLYGDDYHTYNVCDFGVTSSFKHVVMYTNIPFPVAAMPVVTIKGFMYATSDIESKLTFYMYNGEFYNPRVQNLGAYDPTIYLFSYNDNGTNRVAIGLEGNFYFMGFQADVHFPTLGNIYRPTTQWATAYDNVVYTEQTSEEDRIIPSIGTNHCVKVPKNKLSDIPTLPLSIANGGTGQTTGVNAANALIGSLPQWTEDPSDDVYLIRRDTGGSSSFGQVKFSTVWNYIKSKIASVLGIGGSNGVPTAPTAAAGTNTTQIATTAFVNAATIGKVDKVTNAINGNFASLDANGNIKDSGSKLSDFATASQGALADSSIQGVSVNGTALTPSSGVVNVSVPTETSDLINDSGFVNTATDELLNYYKKSQTYSQAEVDALLASVNTFEYVSVDTLPTASSSTMGKVYIYNGHRYITEEDGGSYDWVDLGSYDIDLSGYVTTVALNTALEHRPIFQEVTETQMQNMLDNGTWEPGVLYYSVEQEEE